MPDGPTLWIFTAAALVLLLSPGPAVTYVMARSVAQGTLAGVVSQLGLCAGLLVHVIASVSGISAAVARWPAVLDLVSLAGAAYLVWLAVSALRGGATEEVGGVDSAPSRRLFVDGFVIDALNPKPALFFVAFLPQFVDPKLGSLSGQLTVLGLLFVALAMITGGAYAAIAGGLGRRLRERPGSGVWGRRLSAAVFLALAAATVAGNRR